MVRLRHFVRPLLLIWVAGTISPVCLLPTAYAQEDNGAPAKLSQRQKEELLAEAEKLVEQVIEMFEREEFAELIPRLQRVVEIRTTVHGPHHPSVAGALAAMAEAHEKLQKFDDAVATLSRAVDIDKRAFGEKHPRFADRVHTLAALHRRIDRDQQVVT